MGVAGAVNAHVSLMVSCIKNPGMKIILLGWLLGVVLFSSVVGLCPPNDSPVTGNCVSDCTDDANCSNTRICCPVGCSQICTDNCSSIGCRNITCPAPRLTVTVQGECCESCVDSNELCPANVSSDNNCSVDCYNDSQCANNEVCCGNGCGQTCVDRCQHINCPITSCTPPSVPTTNEGECCPSCTVSQCTIQCIGSNAPRVVVCENGSLVDNASYSCDLLLECSYSNITDALQCAAGINDSLATEITSLIINQPADEMLQTTTFADVDLPSLRSLSIINGGLKYIEDDAFNVSSLMGLTHLNLSGNALTELVYADFRGLDDLKYLDIGNNGIQQLDADLRPLFMSLQVVNLVGSNFICDCCLEWLVECEYNMVMLSTEYCSNSQDLASNTSFAELTAEDICPTCRNGTFRYSGSCSRQCVSNMMLDCSTDDHYDLDFWVIIVIGAVAGIIVAAIVSALLYLSYYCCHKKKQYDRNRSNTNHEMFKLEDNSSSASSHNNLNQFEKGTLGFRNRLVRRFTRKETTFDDTEKILRINKTKSKKKTRKEDVWLHNNIYDVDEVDSKFEAFFLEEVRLEDLLPYIVQLSFTWYELGQRLGLDPAKLDTIKFAIGTLEGRCQKMLEIWLSSEDPLRCNWETVVNALKSSESNTEHQVADDIYNPRSIRTVMGIIFVPAQNKKEDDEVWQAWNFFLSKAEGSKSYCREFLKVNGLDLLLYCNQLFTSDQQLKAVFFYILDVIAQYPELLNHLMRSDVMYACKAMLSSKYYPVISFTAGSVIVRMAIHGDEVWGYLIPDKEEMLNSLSRAISKWDLEHKKQDNFARGLQKLDYLIEAAMNEDERVAYWGIWALANHCITNGSTYCVKLRSTGQLDQIEQLMRDTKTVQVKQLCTRVITCCREYNEM